MENINEINIIVKDKKPTSEAVKRAKAKYYQKKKLDDAYMPYKPGDVTSAQPAFYVPTIRNSSDKCKGIF